MNNDELQTQWDAIVKELSDWTCGTFTKGYDKEETFEVIAEDTKEYTDKLFALYRGNTERAVAEERWKYIKDDALACEKCKNKHGLTVDCEKIKA